MDETSDEAIIRAAKSRNDFREAFVVLARRHSGGLYRFALAIVRSAHDAEDIVQETLLRALRAAHGFKGRSSVRTWLFRIARNVALNLVAKSGRRTAEPKEGSDRSPGPGEEAARKEELAQLRRALDELPDHAREIVELFYMQGLKCREMAEIIGSSEGAVRVALFRAVERLRANTGKSL